MSLSESYFETRARRALELERDADAYAELAAIIADHDDITPSDAMLRAAKRHAAVLGVRWPLCESAAVLFVSRTR